MAIAPPPPPAPASEPGTDVIGMAIAAPPPAAPASAPGIEVIAIGNAAGIAVENSLRDAITNGLTAYNTHTGEWRPLTGATNLLPSPPELRTRQPGPFVVRARSARSHVSLWPGIKCGLCGLFAPAEGSHELHSVPL